MDTGQCDPKALSPDQTVDPEMNDCEFVMVGKKLKKKITFWLCLKVLWKKGLWVQNFPMNTGLIHKGSICWTRPWCDIQANICIETDKNFVLNSTNLKKETVVWSSDHNLHGNWLKFCFEFNQFENRKEEVELGLLTWWIAPDQKCWIYSRGYFWVNGTWRYWVIHM